MRFLHVPGYIAWLVLQVLIAATAIIVDNLRPRQRQHPELVAMPLRVSSEAEIAWLSTSITMTPGTLVCGIRNVGKRGAGETGATNAEPGTTKAEPADARFGDDGPGKLFIIHAIFGADLDELFDSLYDMEERMAPRVRDLPRPHGFVFEEYDKDVHPDPGAITGTAAETERGLPGPYPLADDDVLDDDADDGTGGRKRRNTEKEEPRHE